MEVDPEQVSQCGCAAITPTGEQDVVTVTDLVEKPVPGSAPSNWILIGRYVCDPGRGHVGTPVETNEVTHVAEN